MDPVLNRENHGTQHPERNIYLLGVVSGECSGLFTSHIIMYNVQYIYIYTLYAGHPLPSLSALSYFSGVPDIAYRSFLVSLFHTNLFVRVMQSDSQQDMGIF